MCFSNGYMPWPFRCGEDWTDLHALACLLATWVLHLILVTHDEYAPQGPHAQLPQLALPIQRMWIIQRSYRVDDGLHRICEHLASEDELLGGALQAGLYLAILGHDRLYVL